jgi:hypothetical protein
MYSTHDASIDRTSRVGKERVTEFREEKVVMARILISTE